MTALIGERKSGEENGDLGVNNGYANQWSAENR